MDDLGVEQGEQVGKPSPFRLRPHFLADRLRSLASVLGISGFLDESLDVARASSALEGHRTTTVFDRHAILAQNPKLWAAIIRFLEDPGPRMPGLRMRVRPCYDGMYERGVEIVMVSETPDWCLNSCQQLCSLTLADVELDRVGGPAGSRFFDMQLERLHGQLVKLLREHREHWPKRRVRIVEVFGPIDPAIWRGYW